MSMISWLDQDAPQEQLGGKGANLSRLLRAGFPVPNGFVVTTEAYEHHLRAHGLQERLEELLAAGQHERVQELFDAPLPDDLARQVVAAWHDLGAVPVAVRSSGSAEDGQDASSAGQQDSWLGVDGEAGLCEAVRACFASLWNERAIAYRASHGIEQSGARLAVVVQRMVEPQAAGVMFTANPTNGRRDEVVVTVAGPGTDQTEGAGSDTAAGAQPALLVVRDGRVLAGPAAEQGQHERPAPAAHGLDEGRVLELAALGRRVEALFGCPQDVEWVLTGGVLVLVQARPVTALPEPAGEVPQDWPVDDDKGMYVRSGIVDLMPDPLSPLFADLVRPAVVESLRDVLAGHFQEDVLAPGDHDLATVNGYAYHHHTREGMLALLRRGPRSLAALGGRAQPEPQEVRDRARDAYATAVAQWQDRDLAGLGSMALLRAVEELLRAGCTYHGWLQATLPLGSSAELPFARLYAALARQADGPPPGVFLSGHDSRSVQARRSVWQLAQWCRGRPGLADELLSGRPLAELPQDLRERLDEHLSRFGHAVANLDLMVPVPAEDPGAVLEELRANLRGQGQDPDAVLAEQAAERERAEQELWDRLDPARRAILEPLLARAQRVAPAREDGLADVGLAWPLMRRMLHTLGQRLVDVGALDAPEDVFWLTRAELGELCDHLDAFAGPRDSLAGIVEQRRVQWRGRRAAQPPQFLPRNAWFRMFRRLVPAMDTPQRGPVIQGLGATQGRITAPARLVRGPQDFEAMLPGEVIVSPATTTEWTPLFAVAAAVVTDVGGPLSHSAIVAREFAIPAVLGTGIATRRIRTGMLVTVDADRGTVTLPEGEAPVETGFRPRVPYKFALGAAAAAALLLKRLT